MSGIGRVSALALVGVITVAAPSAAQSGSADDTTPRRYHVEGSVFGDTPHTGDHPGGSFFRPFGGGVSFGEFVNPRFAYKLELTRSAREHRQWIQDGTHVETDYQLSSFAVLVGYQPASHGRMRLTLLAGLGAVWKQEVDTTVFTHPFTMAVIEHHSTSDRAGAVMALGADLPVPLGWGFAVVPQVRLDTGPGGGVMRLAVAGRWSFGTLPGKPDN